MLNCAYKLCIYICMYSSIKWYSGSGFDYI